MSTNSFKIKNSAVLTPKDLSTLVSPEAGEIACDINDSNKIKRYDAASSSWVEVGSGGVGSVDIMFVQDFESASLSSFTQTGLSLSTTNPLHGKVSALLTHDASVNQSFKQVVAVDPKFRGQAMVLDLNIKSAASAGNVVIKVTDESNSADLIVSEALQLSNDVSGRRSSVSFTIPSTCSSISYTITALPEAGSPVTRIDDIVSYLSDVALLETSVEVPVMTAWQDYTPTFQGFGTPSNVQFEYRQVGENVEIRGKFTSGTPTAVEARVGLPAGLSSAGTSIIPSLQMVGKAGHSGFASTYFGKSILIEPSVSYLTVGTQTNASHELAKALGTSLLSTGDSLSFFASVPCAGLSATSTKTIPLTQSGLVQEADSALRINGALGYGSTNTRVVRFNNAGIQENIGSAITYNPSTTLGDSFTINEDGIYNINVTLAFNSTTSNAFPYIIKNPSDPNALYTAYALSSIIGHSYTHGGATGNPDMPLIATVKLLKGDIVWVTNPLSTPIALSTTDSTRNFVQITKQGSLKQVSVSSDQKITIPTSELRFEGASSRGSTATAIVKFDTMAKLRGDAFTVESDSVLGTRITMKKAGKLNVSAALNFSAGQYIAISKNQTTLTAFPSSSETMNSAYSASAGVLTCSYDGFVNVGDILRIACNNVNPIVSSQNVLNLSFQEQDISVSVTNTLPQFSESDSYLRVSGANGFGSTATTTRRFSSVETNIGSDISYFDSPDLGGQFTALADGIYNVYFQEGTTANNDTASVLIFVNGVNTLVSRDRATTTTSLKEVTVSGSLYLTAGSVVTATVANVAQHNGLSSVFTISKVGKPNVTGVDVTPFVNVPQPESQSSRLIQTATFGNADITGTLSYSNGSGLYSYNSSTGIYTALKAARINMSVSLTNSGAASTSAGIILNGVNLAQTFSPAVASYIGSASMEFDVSLGDTWKARNTSSNNTSAQVITVTASAVSEQILTAPQTFSTDTASLQYASSSAYTLSTLQNAPVGTFITFTYAANTNTRTQTTTAPTQTTANMNTNGILLYTRAYNAASTAANPAAIAIQIGKGLKGRSLDLYKSAGKATAGSLDFSFRGTDIMGATAKDYNENTGILIVDLGWSPDTTNTQRFLQFSDISFPTSGYLVINASKSPALTGVPLLQPRIATLSDVKASGTAGGTATSGSYQTRTLNTLSDPSGIVTSLASNQFTLPAGEYYIEASAPVYYVNAHKIKIRNITDSTDAIIGTTVRAMASGGDGDSTPAILSGYISISNSKTFELQHRVSSTWATTGFGIACSFGDNEVYALVKITKVK